MPTYWVSEPYVNLRMEDEPLGYSGARGPRVSFHLSYRQRGAVVEDASVFGLGNNWSCSFRAYLADLGGTPDHLRLHRGGAGFIDYTNGVAQYRDGSIVTSITGGYQIEYRDGAKDTFTTSFLDNSVTYYFLTTHTDPTGNALTYTYSSGTTITLTSVTDPDGRTTQLYYENTSWPIQITKVVDPFNRTNLLKYDANGYLTNVVDVAGITNSFQYDAGNPGWITNMTTPYGSTGFIIGGVNATSTDFNTTGNVVNRYIQVNLPTGGTELYLFRQDCSGFMSSTYSSVPSTSPLGNTLDNVDQQNRNSFHWSPLQYQHLSTTDPNSLTSADYSIGRLRHWLIDPNSADASCTLSLERAPSPDGSATGQLTWYDYDGKTSGNNYIGTNAQPSFVALVLSDGTSRYTHFSHGSHSQVTQTIGTYSKTDGSVGLRTNNLYYAANNVDLLQWLGPNNEQVVSNYFSAGNVYHQPDATYDALSQSTSYLYNGNRQVMRVISPASLTTTNTYFSSGTYANWLSSSVDVDISRTNSYTYANGLVYSHTDERGLITTNTWDNLQRLTGTTFPDGTTISNQYTALDMTGTKDRDGNWTRFLYNALRQKIAETNANGIVTGYGYCTCGLLSTVTNAVGTSVQQITSFNYDYQGNLTYVYLPDTTVTNWYNSMAQLIITSIGWGYRTNYYNNQGLVTNVSNVYGIEQATTFDNENRPLYVTDSNGTMLTNTYDVLSQLLTRGYPDGGIEKFGYSARGLTAYTNQISQITRFAYDPARRKNFETNANTELIQYYYMPAGDLTNLVDGKGQSTKWNYDAYGQVTNKLDQTGTEILRYTYDPAGRLTNRWSKQKGNTAYVFDSVGNVTAINYPVSTHVSLTYDALNRLTKMVDAAGTNNYTYTIGGQLLTEGGVFASDTVTNTYLNRLRTALSLAQPSGSWTNGFIYDAAGRLTNVTSQVGKFGYQFVAGTSTRSLIARLLLPNTSYITNAYDSVARVKGTWLKNSSNTTLDSAVYGYNQASQRTAFTNAAGTFVQYTYDNIGQLKVGDSSVNSEDRGYTYDTAWNLNYRTNNGVLSTFKVDTKNELTNAFSATYAYDSNGNLTSSYGAHGVYTYDDENRLLQWFSYTNSSSFPSNNDMRTDFVYDGLGRMRQRSEYLYNTSGGQGPLAPGGWLLQTTTEYIYDGNRVIQERDGSNNPGVAYTRGTDLSGSLEGAGGIGGLLARSTGTAWNYTGFYHADGNGNITYLVDTNQAMLASFRYDPYGNTISASGAWAGANKYRFSSKEIHVNSGMYYYLYRFYDPNLQRWIGRDPIGERGGLNLYAVLVNNVLSGVDRFGLDGMFGSLCLPMWPPPSPIFSIPTVGEPPQPPPWDFPFTYPPKLGDPPQKPHWWDPFLNAPIWPVYVPPSPIYPFPPINLGPWDGEPPPVQEQGPIPPRPPWVTPGEPAPGFMPGITPRPIRW
jgi:RHS repeat-associated protein